MERTRGPRALVVTVDAEALRHALGAATLTIDGAPTAGGWSNETMFVTADARPLVVRLSPSGSAMFPSYDLGLQARCLRYAASAELPVPTVLTDDDGGLLGRPFFVMNRLPGRVPADDDPPFTKAGFLFEATAEQQRTFSLSAIDRLVEIHRTPSAGFLPVGPSPHAHLRWCADLYGWVDIAQPLLEETHRRLAADVPGGADAPTGLLWGDARPANMLVDERFAVTGLLDWELAANGPGEFDVAWFLEMNRMRSTGMGIAPLPGFLTDAKTWDRWSALIGRPATNIGWYHRYAAYRVAVLLLLFLRAMISRGRLPHDHRLTRDNLATRRLESLFGS